MNTPNQACDRLQEALALLAGGDLPTAQEPEVRGHLGTCSSCEAQLAGLRADQGVMARLAQLPAEVPESLAPSVLARLATEAHEEAVRRLTPTAAARRSPPPHLVGAFARAAAAVAIVVSAALLGLSALDHGGLAESETTIAAADVTPQDLQIRRSSAGLDLSWAGDGRELGTNGSVGTYRVLASADPRDFSGAKPVEVAGRHLVSDLPLPAARAADRKVTYFRVE